MFKNLGLACFLHFFRSTLWIVRSAELFPVDPYYCYRFSARFGTRRSATAEMTLKVVQGHMTSYCCLLFHSNFNSINTWNAHHLPTKYVSK